MNEPAPTALVLGATSLVGRRLAPRLLEGGWDVTALSRSPQADGAVRWLSGGLEDVPRLPAVDVAFSLMPLWLLPQALPRLQAGRLVAFSSTSRFTKAASKDAGERAVAKKLADAEAATIAACEAAGIAWTLLRPTLIYSEGEDKNVSRLAGLIRRLGFLPLAGGGEGRRQPVHADDLAMGAIAAASAPAACNKAYDTPGGETLTYRQMAERVFEALGKKPMILNVPPALWRLGLAAASPLLPGATAAMGSRMSDDLVFDAQPAARDFGWSPRAFRPRF